MTKAKPKLGDLRVWWIPQIPGKAFLVDVQNTYEAKLMLGTLARYDTFQLVERVRPDFSNIGGLEVFGVDGWEDWADEDGEDIYRTEMAKIEGIK